MREKMWEEAMRRIACVEMGGVEVVSRPQGKAEAAKEAKREEEERRKTVEAEEMSEAMKAASREAEMEG